MGFERLASVVTGAVDAYATELFAPTIRKVVERSGVPYRDLESVHHRVIADHIRSVSMCIADGILPSNDGPGYVIKMLLRRAARKAWQLGVQEPMLFELVGSVADAMGGAYPNLRDQATRVAAIVKAEESQFLETLGAGIERVSDVLDGLQGAAQLPGEVAFDLWQTYGFPLDLTVEMAAERGVEVDREGYAQAREAARDISRAGSSKGALFGGVDLLADVAATHAPTPFNGYNQEAGEAMVVALLDESGVLAEAKEGQSITLVLSATPCYPEGGGQIGDAGKVSWTGGAAFIHNTLKGPNGLIVHRAQVSRGALQVGDSVTVAVDPARHETRKHHTATHLLHAALRRVVGDHVAQAGSLVTPERLRFDVSHGSAISMEQLREAEMLVNGWIQADLEVEARTLPIDEARAAGAMMLFGEKYGAQVRMVSIGQLQQSPSIELCGGTHVQRTGEIGVVLITREEAASAGVRRIEALAGRAALIQLQATRATLDATAKALGAPSDELEARALKLQQELKAAQREAAQLRDKLASQQAGVGAQSSDVAGLKLASAALDGLDATALRNAADTLMAKERADVVVVGSGTLLVVKASEAARAKGALAGSLIKALAQRGGGGGGGRPDMAQAGVRDAAGLAAALAAASEVLSEVVGA
jgi:alanyl-tRNA synthetase